MTQSISLIEQYSRCYGMVPLWYPEAWEDLKWVHFYHESLRRLTSFFFYLFIYLLMFQVRFVKNVTLWKEMKPAFYHGHVSFLDFTKCVLCALVVPCANSLSLFAANVFAWKMLFRVVSGFAFGANITEEWFANVLQRHCDWMQVFLHSQQSKKKKKCWCCWLLVALKRIAASF